MSFHLHSTCRFEPMTFFGDPRIPEWVIPVSHHPSLFLPVYWKLVHNLAIKKKKLKIWQLKKMKRKKHKISSIKNPKNRQVAKTLEVGPYYCLPSARERGEGAGAENKTFSNADIRMQRRREQGTRGRRQIQRELLVRSSSSRSSGAGERASGSSSSGA